MHNIPAHADNVGFPVRGVRCVPAASDVRLHAMSAPPITERQIKAFRRFIERLPHGKDIDLVILKAHLLIEEEVNAVIRARLDNPEVLLVEERFESSYRIRLAQAFFSPEFQPWLWKSLAQLNKLRNRVAHNIDPKGRENLIKDIIHTIPGGSIATIEASLQEQFELALWQLHEATSALVEPLRGVPLELVPLPDAI